MTTLADELIRSRGGGSGGDDDASGEPNYLTVGGKRLTVGGHRLLAPAPPDAGNEDEADPPILSSDWTGMASLRERVAAFKSLGPIALAAVDKLIVELDVPGDNGGPLLDERSEAVEALRALHDALGSLLVMVDRRDFSWVDGEGFAASCAAYAIRAHDKLRHDPIPFVAASLILALFTAVGFPGAGALASGMALTATKDRPRS